MADESIIKKALDLARQGQEFVFPHASKNPFAPMAYVKDFNEFFLPSAQMAIDEATGEEEYPAWAYALASVPFIGKPAKAVAKIAGKGGKAAAKTGRMVDDIVKAEVVPEVTIGRMSNKELQAAYEKELAKGAEADMDYIAMLKDSANRRGVKGTGSIFDEGGIQSLFDELNAAEKAWSDKPSLVNQSNRDKALEKLLNSPEYNGHDFVEGKFVPRKASPEWTLVKEEPKKIYGVSSWDGKTTTFDTMEKAKSFVEELRKRGLNGFKIKEY